MHNYGWFNVIHAKPTKICQCQANNFLFQILISEHNHQLGTINNNNTSSINNNTATKSGTYSPKLHPTTNGDHKTQAQTAAKHRNGKSSILPGSGGTKSTGIIMTTVPQIQTKQIELNSSSQSQVNGDGVGESNETLITTALSSIDSIDCDAIDHCENNVSRHKDEERLIQNLEKADQTVVALGILVQHLTFNVSLYRLCLTTTLTHFSFIWQSVYMNEMQRKERDLKRKTII